MPAKRNFTRNDSKPLCRWKGSFKKAHAWGLSTMVDLYGCDPELIRSADAIRTFVFQLCELIKMRRFGDCHVVNFGEDERVSGYSMFQLIETSNISGHFANASNAAYLDIFSCKAYEPIQVRNFAKEFFKAQDAIVQVAMRR